MKKITLSLLCVGFLTTSVNAEFTKAVCSESDLAAFSDERYLFGSMSVLVPYMLFDNKTIKIDKKNKTIDVWIIDISNPFDPSEVIRNSGDRFTNFGYVKRLIRFFYTTNQYQNLQWNVLNCDGSIIDQSSSTSELRDLSPNSMNEVVLGKIIKK